MALIGLVEKTEGWCIFIHTQGGDQSGHVYSFIYFHTFIHTYYNLVLGKPSKIILVTQSAIMIWWINYLLTQYVCDPVGFHVLGKSYNFVFVTHLDPGVI